MRFADRAVLWAEIRKRKTFRPADLRGVGAPWPTVKSFVAALTKAGVLRLDLPDSGWPNGASYTLVKDVGRRCPRFRANGALNTKPTLTERLWAAMKPLRGFTNGEIASLIRARSADVVGNYVRTLHRAGYLDAEKPRGQGLAVHYRLRRSMDTGPEPPIVLRDGSVWDANRLAVVWTPVAEPEEVAA